MKKIHQNVWAIGAALFAFAGFLAVILASSSCQEAIAATDKPKKIVFIAGKPSHPSGQHEFNAGAIILARCLNEQSGLPVEVKVVHNGWPEDESVFSDADAVIIYSDGNARHPINGNEKKFDAMVAKGLGVMFMHYGVEVPPGEQGEFFKKWIGGHYEAGFSTNPHWTAAVEIDKEHPIANGVPDFSANRRMVLQYAFFRSQNGPRYSDRDSKPGNGSIATSTGLPPGKPGSENARP